MRLAGRALLLFTACYLSGCIGEGVIWESPSRVDIDENIQGEVYRIQAKDQKSGKQITRFELAGIDADKFVITEGNRLSFVHSQDFENPQDANQDNVYELQVKRVGSVTASALPLTVAIKDMPVSTEIARLFPLDGGVLEKGVNGVTPVIDLAVCSISLPFGEISEAIGYDKQWVYGDWPFSSVVDNTSQFILPELAPEFDHALFEKPYDAECLEGDYFQNRNYFTLPEAFYVGDAEPIDVYTLSGQKFEVQSRLRSTIDLSVIDVSANNLQLMGFYVALWNETSLWLLDRRTASVITELDIEGLGHVEGVGVTTNGSILLMIASESVAEIKRDVYRFDADREYALETIYEELFIDHGPGYFKHEEITLLEINGEVVVQGINLGGCDQTNTYVAHFKVSQLGVRYFASDMFECAGVEGSAESEEGAGVESPFISFGLSANTNGEALFVLPLDNILSNVGGRYSFEYHFMEADYRLSAVMVDVGDYYYAAEQFRFSCQHQTDCDYPDRVFYLSEEGAIYNVHSKKLWTSAQARRITSNSLTVLNFDLDRDNHLLYAVGYWGEAQVPVYAVIHYLTGAASYLPLGELLNKD